MSAACPSSDDQWVHQSALSFDGLRFLEITDRSSCFAVLVRKEMASPIILSQQQFFGQFGPIHSIRILESDQINDPQRVFVRFASELSAVRAISWCNHQPVLFLDAGHGYTQRRGMRVDDRLCEHQSDPRIVTHSHS